MAFTTYGSTQVLSGLIGRSSTGPLSNCYIALSTTAPNADGTNFTEPSSAAGYARAIIGLSGTSATQVMSAPSAGSTSNTSIIFFPEATASWGTVTHFGLIQRRPEATWCFTARLPTPSPWRQTMFRFSVSATSRSRFHKEEYQWMKRKKSRSISTCRLTRR
jgi:hypothetical protein